MEKKLKITRKSAFIAVAFLTCPQPGFAYIDPGTGSMLLQGLLAGVAGLIVVLKLYWFKIKNFFVPKAADTPSSDPESADEKPSEGRRKGSPD